MKIAKFKIPVSLKNRKALAIACIIVSLVVGFVLMPLASTAATVTVVRAKQDIPLGAQITKSMVETVKVGRKNLPSNVLRNFSDVVGKYSAVTITSGDYITSAKLNTTGSTYDLSSGQLLISVTVKNFADSLSGKLQSGDIVSVLFPPAAGNSLSSAAETDADCPPELQYVKVVTVTNANGGDTDEKTVKKAASSGSNSDNLPATVTLLVNERQAQILAGQESNTVHFALACRGNGKRRRTISLKRRPNILSRTRRTVLHPAHRHLHRVPEHHRRRLQAKAAAILRQAKTLTSPQIWGRCNEQKPYSRRMGRKIGG